MFQKCSVALISVLFCLNGNAGLFSSNIGLKQECFSKHSKAWCILDAADMSDGIDDVSQKMALDQAAQSTGSKAADVGMVGMTAGGFFRTPGLSTGANTVGLLLSLLSSGQKARVLGQNMVLAWMPIELAKTREDALVLMHNIILDATIKSLPDFSLVESISTPAFHSDSYTLDRTDSMGFTLKGGVCDVNICKLVARKGGKLDIVGYEPKEGVAPDWLGGYKAWVFDFKSRIQMLSLVVNSEVATNRYAPNLSMQLPDWAYLSITPEYSGYGTLQNRGLRIPTVFHKGVPMIPVFPEINLEKQSSPSTLGSL